MKCFNLLIKFDLMTKSRSRFKSYLTVFGIKTQNCCEYILRPLIIQLESDNFNQMVV